MKKYLITMLGVAAIISLISCGSTPNAEPVDDTVTEGSSGENQNGSKDAVTATNEALLAQAAAARQKAIEAGADKAYPEVFASTDKLYDEVKSEVEGNPSVDASAKIKDVIDRYNALATATLAKEMKAKADELGVSDAEAEKALADFESSSTSSDMKTNANKALSAYTALLAQHMAALVKTERNAALEAKKKADSVKAGVAKKAEYTEASNTFKKADAAFVTKNVEGAYQGYRTAKNSFNSLYESIYEKRAAAQAAIERAKKRVAEAENYTKEADSIAPLTGDVAGIEKEDAVLLESDNFANPDDAVINVEDSAAAKAAAAIDEAVNAAADSL